MTVTSKKTTVVIPALNEESNIGACLEALANGSLLPAEIIVVDGESYDNTVRIAQQFGAKVLNNERRTAAAGRNVGWKMVKTDYVAFTDADCIPDSGWLQCLEHRLTNDVVDGIAGRVVPRCPRNEYEAYWNHLARETLMQFGDDPYPITEKNIIHSVVTASCAYRKDALYQLGGFDEWFGNNAEDVDLTWRAIDAGLSLVYEPNAIVHASGVLNIAGIRQKSFRNGVSSSKLQKRYGGTLNFDPNIYRLLGRTILDKEPNPNKWLDLNELIWHLLGKYSGSIRFKVINF